MAGCTCPTTDEYRQLDRSCPQHGDVAERRRREWEFADRELASIEPLPTVEELAEPIVQALYLFYVGVGREDRVHLLVERLDRAEFDETVDVDAARQELAEYLACIDGVARIVGAAVGDLTVAPTMSAATGGAATVLRTIAGTDAAERALMAPIVRAMTDRVADGLHQDGVAARVVG